MPQSRSIAEYLATLPNITPRLWPDFFEPGLLTLEAIDLMLTKVSGGVLVATPDEQNSRGQFFPTANVVFELGVLSARIGVECRPLHIRRSRDPDRPSGFHSHRYGSLPIRTALPCSASLRGCANETPEVVPVLAGHAGRCPANGSATRLFRALERQASFSPVGRHRRYRTHTRGAARQNDAGAPSTWRQGLGTLAWTPLGSLKGSAEFEATLRFRSHCGGYY